MKARKTAYLTVALLLGAASCTPPDMAERQYVIEIDERGLEIETKATAIASVPSTLWWCATTGTSGTADAQKYAPTQGTVSAGKIETGKYQTATPTAYNWYLSNQTMAVAASGPVITVADNSVDIVAGAAKASTSASPSVVLEHIFARTGSLTFNAQTDYDVSGISWSISKGSSGTAGTYNMATRKWAPNAGAMGQTPLTSSSDMYLIPGTYTFTITYTLSRDHYRETFTRSGTAVLVQGRVNSLTATATGGDAVDITVSTTLSAWGAGTGKELTF